MVPTCKRVLISRGEVRRGESVYAGAVTLRSVEGGAYTAKNGCATKGDLCWGRLGCKAVEACRVEEMPRVSGK